MARQDVLKRNKKHSKFDREELVHLIACDILGGVSRNRALEKLKKDQYDGFISSGYSRATWYNLVEEAYIQCRPRLEADMQRQRELFIARYEDILEEARDARDRQNAIAALKEMGRILGVYEPDKVDVTANVNVDISFGLEDDETELQD